MYRTTNLKEAVQDMFPCSEDEFFKYLDKSQNYNVQYGQTLWYMDTHNVVIAIQDGDNCFYIK